MNRSQIVALVATLAFLALAQTVSPSELPATPDEAVSAAPDAATLETVKEDDAVVAPAITESLSEAFPSAATTLAGETGSPAGTVAEVPSVPEGESQSSDGKVVATPEASAPPLGADALTQAAAVAEAANPFGLKLLSEQVALAPKDNHLLSPLSLATAFGMLAEGAAGETLALLRTELGLESAGLAPGDLGLLGRVLADTAGKSDFRTAQGIWLASGMSPQAAFVAAGREQFSAEVEEVDFADSSTLERLNGWFSERTGGLIDPMFTRLDEGIRFVLGNALYFNAAWQHPFDPEQTRLAPFHAPNGTQEVSTLHGTLSGLAYREAEGAQGARLPFQNGDFELIVLLPGAEQSPAVLLSPEALESWLQRGDWDKRTVDLALPKLDLSVGGDASEALRKAGLEPLFANADLSRLAGEPLAVDQVIHKVALKLDERGAEAAAATAILGVRSVAPAEPTVTLTVDRPFVALIRHNATGALVLAGVIQSP